MQSKDNIIRTNGPGGNVTDELYGEKSFLICGRKIFPSSFLTFINLFACTNVIFNYADFSSLRKE